MRHAKRIRNNPSRALPRTYVSMWEVNGTAERTPLADYADRVSAERRAAAVDGVRCILPAEWDAGRVALMRKLGAA